MEQERPADSPGTEARKVFETQSDNILYLLNAILRDIKHINDPIDAIQKLLAPTTTIVSGLSKDTPQPAMTSALAKLSSNIRTLKQHTDDVAARVQANVQTHPFLFDWMLVMKVAFAEAYLESVLLLLVTDDPKLMKNKVRAISNTDVLKLEAEVPAEDRWKTLLRIVCSRWTNEFLRAKPETWIVRLREVGVPNYRDDLGKEMNTIWEWRHAIVHAHSAGLSNRTVASGEAAKTIYVQHKSRFFTAVNTVYEFVTTTDAFVVGHLSAKG